MREVINQPELTSYHFWVNNYSQVVAGFLQGLGSRLASFLIGHHQGLINLLLVIVLLGSLVAPCLAHWGYVASSKIVYGAYHLACHQKDSRCLYVFGHKLGFCMRCVSIYLSLLIFGLAWSLLGVNQKKIKPIGFWLAFLLAIPLILDGTTQSLGLRESNAFLRMATGCLFSLSAALWAYPRLKPEFMSLNSVTDESFG